MAARGADGVQKHHVEGRHQFRENPGLLLAGAILSAQLLAVLMANTGGGRDNAKKKSRTATLGGRRPTGPRWWVTGRVP